MDSIHGAIQADAVDGVREARWLLATRANLLFTGPERIASEILQSLRPPLSQPAWETNATRLSLPTASTGTLIIRQAACLAAEDQMRLSQWIDDHRSTQLITITSEPLFPLVKRGTFLETLYYMLNTVQVDWSTAQLTSSIVGLRRRRSETSPLR
jgi:hypothetical protein